MKPTQFTIGRDGAHADVVPDGAHLNTVSRCHLQVTANWDKGTFRIQDNRTANGTFAKMNGKWAPIEKAVVDLTTPLRLGQLETSFAELQDKIGRVEPRREAPQGNAHSTARPTPEPGQPLRRNPITGEIIK